MPVLTPAEDGDKTAPLALTEPIDRVIHVEGDLTAAQLASDLHWLVPILLVNDVYTVLEELLDIPEAQAARL